ncbi:MAG: hypothetical protein MJE68_33450 [Proteobacteria bacterium]|nr:hypothetical protein [Pseudomonadota bacterium]
MEAHALPSDPYDTLEEMHLKSHMIVQPVRCVGSMAIVVISRHQSELMRNNNIITRSSSHNRKLVINLVILQLVTRAENIWWKRYHWAVADAQEIERAEKNWSNMTLGAGSVQNQLTKTAYHI